MKAVKERTDQKLLDTFLLLDELKEPRTENISLRERIVLLTENERQNEKLRKENATLKQKNKELTNNQKSITVKYARRELPLQKKRPARPHNKQKQQTKKSKYSIVIPTTNSEDHNDYNEIEKTSSYTSDKLKTKCGRCIKKRINTRVCY